MIIIVINSKNMLDTDTDTEQIQLYIQATRQCIISSSWKYITTMYLEKALCKITYTNNEQTAIKSPFDDSYWGIERRP